jgi:hypothetical protein
MLPEGHRLTNPPYFRESLAARGPVNTNAPGLVNNKNGPPGPEGNQKGPPVAVISQSPLSETTLSSSNKPPPPPSTASTSPALGTTLTPTSSSDLTPSSVIVTSIVPTPSTIFGASSVPAPPPVESLTTAYVSASSDGLSTSTKYLVSQSPSSTLSATFYSVETTLRTSFTYTSSAITIQTGIAYSASNATSQSKYTTTSPGRKAGIVFGTIGTFEPPLDRDHRVFQANDQAAGFAFILILIFLLFKWRRPELPKALPSPVRRLLGPWGSSCWLPHRQTPDAMSDSLLAVEVGSSGSPAWDYRATFARPTMIERARQSLHKSLTRLVQINPLSLNPIMPQAAGVRTPSRKSFASFFHRRSAASTHPSVFCPSPLQGESGSVIDPRSPPPLPPPYAAPPSPRPLTMPPQAFQLPWHHRNSQMTLASEESEARSLKSVPSWVKFHYPHRLRSGAGLPQESRSGHPVSPLPISPGSWLKAKVPHRSHSTTASEDEKGHRMASDHSNESAATEQVVFGLSGWKQVQMGRRISGASAHSLLAEKQEA